jgi:hypothetical protein
MDTVDNSCTRTSIEIPDPERRVYYLNIGKRSAQGECHRSCCVLTTMIMAVFKETPASAAGGIHGRVAALTARP